MTECWRTGTEVLRCENSRLSHSMDGGASWVLLPMQQTRWGRLLSFLILEWPPIPIAVGWRQGRIAIAHVDRHEDGSPDGRYVSSFDERRRRWRTRQAGLVRSGGASDDWVAGAGFEIVARVRRNGQRGP